MFLFFVLFLVINIQIVWNADNLVLGNLIAHINATSITFIAPCTD